MFVSLEDFVFQMWISFLLGLFGGSFLAVGPVEFVFALFVTGCLFFIIVDAVLHHPFRETKLCEFRAYKPHMIATSFGSIVAVAMVSFLG